MEILVTVDRQEAGKLVLEYDVGKTFDFPAELLPEAREGDVFRFLIKEEPEERKKREKKIRDIMDRLQDRN